MDEILNKLVESGMLNEADKTLIASKLAEKITEAENDAETRVRSELSARYEQDKQKMVEAADRVLSEVIQKHETEKVAESTKQQEQIKRLRESTTKMRKESQESLRKQAQVFESFIHSALEKELSEFQQDRAQVNEMKQELAQQIVENRKASEKALAEQASIVQEFFITKLDEAITGAAKKEAEFNQAIKESKRTAITESRKIAESARSLLDSEVTKLRETRESLEAERAQEKVQIQENIQKLAESHAAELTSLDKFVVSKLAEELKEFHQDQMALKEMKVTFAKEAKRQLQEAKTMFITNAAAVVDKRITEALAKELSSLHEDIMESKKNMKGRQIFEAFAKEYKTSFINESTEISQISEQLDRTKAELDKSIKENAELNKKVETATQVARLAESQAQRAKVLDELLSPLTKDKREVMHEMLKTTATEKLRESFNKYIPTVLGTEVKKNQTRRSQLTESAMPDATLDFTGDREVKQLESPVHQTTDSDELEQILKLAGINKK